MYRKLESLLKMMRLILINFKIWVIDKDLCLANRKKTIWWREKDIFKRPPLKIVSDLSWDWGPLEMYIIYFLRLPPSKLILKDLDKQNNRNTVFLKVLALILCHIYKWLVQTINRVSPRVSYTPVFPLSAKSCANLVHSNQLNPCVKCSHVKVHRLHIHIYNGSSSLKTRSMEPNLRPSVVIGLTVTMKVLRWISILVCWSGN